MQENNSAPVRVYLRGSMFYLKFYANGSRQVMSTGIQADLKEPKNLQDEPEWWRASSHASEIEKAVKLAEETRGAMRKRQRKVKQQERRKYLDIYLPRDEPLPEPEPAPVRLEEILESYHRHTETMGGNLSAGMREKQEHAIRLLRRFKPNYRFQDIDSDFLFHFRTWLKTANNGRSFAASTMTGYVVAYRSVVKFGIERGLLAGPNPFEGYRFKGSPQLPNRKTAWDEEQAIYRLTYAENRPLFYQIVFQRLTGFRVTWVCGLLLAEIDLPRKRITSLNRKGGRYEDFPIIEPLEWLLRQLEPRYTPYVFKFKNRSTVYAGLQAVCHAVPVESFGTHKLKKNYVSEFRRYTGDEDVINFLSHHVISGPTKVSRRHYVDPEEIFDIAKETLERAQTQKWMDFLLSLDPSVESHKIARWSNPKGDWKRRHVPKYGTKDYKRVKTTAKVQTGTNEKSPRKGA